MADKFHAGFFIRLHGLSLQFKVKFIPAQFVNFAVKQAFAITLNISRETELVYICVLSILFRKAPPQSNYKSSTLSPGAHVCPWLVRCNQLKVV